MIPGNPIHVIEMYGELWCCTVALGERPTDRNDDMHIRNTSIKIAGVGTALPPTRVSNGEIISTQLKSSDEWVRKNLGIIERRISQNASDSTNALAVTAAADAIRQAGIGTSEIGGIIVATATPDQLAPSTACSIQGALGIRNQSFAFDVNAVCTGFIYGLSLAVSLLESSSVDNVLVVGVDVFSRVTDWRDRSCVFFGDGAGAIVVQRVEPGTSFFASSIYADGVGVDGFKIPGDSRKFEMDAHAVYDHATTALPDAIKQLLSSLNIDLSAIDHIVPHQPSIKVLNRLADVLGVPHERVLKNMALRGNTAAATVPLLLGERVSDGTIKPGDLILMAAVGSGWTWGVCVYEWQ